MRAGRREKSKKRGLPAMTSFAGGMAILPKALAAHLAEQGCLAYGNGVQAVQRQEGGWRLQAEQGEYCCGHLVLALPVNQGLALLAEALPEQKPPRAAVPEARILSVLLGFDDRARIPFGFGYLAPEQEQRFALGALFSSHMFPGRAPDGHQLLEVLVGGRRHPERLELGDAELIDAVLRDLGRLMTLPPPSYTAVLRPRAGIPQLEEGYTDLLQWRRNLHAVYPDLHLCGFGWKGIGINDMVKEARTMALRIGSQSGVRDTNEVKGVYF
jgi:oxygen-dependent protoporphyrinogen oxidase